ncbi:uncharacterized protein LOC111617983, partial [Aduncisulcus paluster]
PICVASAVQRTFFVVIAKRLTSYATSHGLVGGYQRGFIPEVDGCMLNIFEMRQWLAESHEHNAVCIDISDAYGSISHNILEVMLSRIIHPASLNIFRAAISTHIHYGEETITTRRGTAQGSAISPILFNMALDTVLNDESKLKIRAFADDITILSTGIEAEEDTKMVVESLGRHGLAVNPMKCFKLGDTRLTIQGALLVDADPMKHKYLGLAATTTEPMRLAAKRKVDKIMTEVKRAISLPFTGLQLVEAFNTYIAPQLVLSTPLQNRLPSTTS